MGKDQQIGWMRAAWYGAEAGIALTLLYALGFLIYAAIQTTMAIVSVPQIDGGVVRTLLATWVSLAVSALAIAAIMAVPAALLGGVTALALRLVLVYPGSAVSPQRAIVAGLTIAACVSVGLGALCLFGLGLRWTPAWAATLLFWIILPLITYTAAAGIAGWRAWKLAA